ncbi:hypothetical protein L873DRAFT_691237 [Choiromyces venosus 120613-1]|uniref:Zn(2)-C6 fungal-type domain-containing protein n=1 Tax=Choiromyces venosus 120613-1 TaxID=1336337 RepID=A0A3N4JVX1_9PEZI|nr:hypothetical protein L873DRAFT_691237 [Choiromyces venosus 120613-1]
MSSDLDIHFPNRRRASTNRQRPKVRDEDRKRIAVACDHCKIRKIKCTGEHPCRQCHISNIPCNYPPASAKIVIPEIYVENLQTRILALEKALIEGIPDQTVREELMSRLGIKVQGHTTPPGSSAVGPSSPSWSGSGNIVPRSPTTPNEDYGEEDEQGRLPTQPENYSSFIGDCGGATFLDKVRDFIRSTLPHVPRQLGYVTGQSFPADPIESFSSVTSSYYSHDNFPLSLPVTEPYALPSKAQVVQCFETFLKFHGCGTECHPISGGGIFHWFNPRKLYLDIESLYSGATYSTSIDGGVSSVDYTTLCTLNMVLALGCQAIAVNSSGTPVEDGLAGLSPSWRPVPGSAAVPPQMQGYNPTRDHPETYPHRSPNTHPGMSFYSRAKLLLVNPIEEATLPCLRTVTLMAFYLLSANRGDAAYMYVGIAVRMAVSHGLHRTWRKGEWVSGGTGRYTGVSCRNTPPLNPNEELRKRIEDEERKREFWNIYVLDRIFSCFMGRPVMLSDDDIDLDLPGDVGDSLPSGVGLSAHIRLCKIIGDVVSRVYRIRKVVSGQSRETQDVIKTIEKVHEELNAWSENLPAEIRLESGISRERSVVLLHLLHNQMYILTTRPSLLLAAKQCTAALYLSFDQTPGLPTHIEEHVSICISAARRNIMLAKQLEESGWISHHSFTDHQYIFNAIVVLLLNRLIREGDQMDSYMTGGNEILTNDKKDISFGILTLSRFGERGNEIAADNAKVSSELDAVVSRILCTRHQESPSSSIQYSDHPTSSVGIVSDYAVADYTSQQYLARFNVSPTPAASATEEMSSWLRTGHFDR